MNACSRRNLLASLAVMVSASIAINVAAQEAAAADAKKDEPVKLEKYVVTGSYIPFAADATAIPVKVVNLDDIKATGETGDLLEVIRKTLPQFFGNSNLGSSNSNIAGGNTNGGSQIKLRNVQTLVLINGRRAAFSPVSAEGGFTFVDVNTIPVHAVKRIEVLSDGASALYGSDAVAGVVNIILKDDFDGFEVGGGYQVATQKGHWEERSGHFTAGGRNDVASITVAGEWVKSDPMFESERAFSADQTGKTGSFPGVVNLFAVLDTFEGNVLLAPGKGAPALNQDLPAAALLANGTYTGPIDDITALFNLAEKATLKTANQRQAATIMYQSKIFDTATLFGDVLLSKTKTFYQVNAQPIVGMPFASAKVTDFGIGVGITDPDHPQNPFNDYVLVRNRFVDHPRGYYYDSNSVHAVLGVRGKFSPNLSYETAYNYNRVKSEYRNTNVINRANLSAAIDANKINLFARDQAPGAIIDNKVLGTATSSDLSGLKSWDGRLVGEIPGFLPGGPLGYAVGAEYRTETLAGNPDPNAATILDPTSPLYGQPFNWDGATSADKFTSSRKVKSVFAEIRVPVVSKAQAIKGIHELEMGVAGRYDKFSDTDDPFVPKVSLKYHPINDEFAFRGSWSKSFTAPELFQLFGPTGVGYTDTIVNFLRKDGATIVEADQAFLRLPKNPNLQPEKSKMYTTGIVYSPRAVKGLNIEMTYFNIRGTGQIARTDDQEVLQDVETNGTASKYADRVRIGGFAGTPITAPGQISQAYDAFGGTFLAVYLTNIAENVVSTEQDGVDVDISYSKQLSSLGTLSVNFRGLWYHHYKVEADEFVGTTNGNAALNGGTIPRWQGTLGASLQRGNWTVGTLIRHIPAVLDTDIDPAAPVASFTSVDLYGSYRFSQVGDRLRWLKGLTIGAGINNVGNRMPPLAPAAWTDSGADTGTYGELGRVVYVDVSYKF